MRTAKRLNEVLSAITHGTLDRLDTLGVRILDALVGVRVPSATTFGGWVRWKADRALIFGINRLVGWRDRLHGYTTAPHKRSVLVDQAWLDHACSKSTIAATQAVLDQLAKDRFWGMTINVRDLLKKGYDRNEQIRDDISQPAARAMLDDGVRVRGGIGSR